MNNSVNEDLVSIETDPRFIEGLNLFNSAEWYLAHDLFEELWHESIDPERRTIQGILQIAVAQIHLNRGNINGAMILYGEGLGRLKDNMTTDLGLDVKTLCEIVELRLKLLQKQLNIENTQVPFLSKR